MKKFRVITIGICALFSLHFTRCRLIDPAEEIPSYIRITSITLNSTPSMGSSSSKISDAWIYVDGELIGAFELPCTVPVLQEGAHSLLVLPGIQQNGLNSLRAIYPFYKGFDTTITLVRSEMVSLAPVVSYFPATTLSWDCNFEQGINLDDITDAPFPNLVQTVSGSLAFEGNSGYVMLYDTINYFYAQSSASYQLNPAGEIYLEMNYKCNQAFSIGLHNITTGAHIPWLEVQSSANWNKIYVRLNDALLNQPSGSYYRVEMVMSAASGISQSELYLDNLKLINQ